MLLSLTCSRGPAFIAVALADGRRRLLRRTATDLERPLAVQMELPRISAHTLLPLAQHIRSMLAASSEEALHAHLSHSGSPASPASCETSPAVPAAMGHVASTGTDATCPAGRLPAPARPGPGGTPC